MKTVQISQENRNFDQSNYIVSMNAEVLGDLISALSDDTQYKKHTTTASTHLLRVHTPEEGYTYSVWGVLADIWVKSGEGRWLKTPDLRCCCQSNITGRNYDTGPISEIAEWANLKGSSLGWMNSLTSFKDMSTYLTHWASAISPDDKSASKTLPGSPESYGFPATKLSFLSSADIGALKKKAATATSTNINSRGGSSKIRTYQYSALAPAPMEYIEPGDIFNEDV